MHKSNLISIGSVGPVFILAFLEADRDVQSQWLVDCILKNGLAKLSQEHSVGPLNILVCQVRENILQIM